MAISNRQMRFILIWLAASNAVAQEGAGLQEPIPRTSDLFVADEVVSIASGHSQGEQTAPAVTSVITAQQIKDTGARNIYDVLRTVPGFFLGQPAIGTQPAISVRGFTSNFNQNILVMLDDVPQHEQVFGNRFAMLGWVPLDLIERIEIMRGPGSALYGADAYSAVINVITRRAPPEKSQVTLGGGSEATRTARYLGGGRLGNADVVGGLEYYETDGSEPPIPVDSQTLLDGLFGTHASLVPGHGNTHQQHLGAHVNATGGAWGLMLRFTQSRDIGLLTGFAGALDPNGHLDTSVIEGGVSWRAQGRDWLFKAQLNGLFSLYQLHNLSYFPAGAFGGAFPDGVRTNVKMEERRIRFQNKLEYHGGSKHFLSAGFGVESAKTDLI